MKKLTFSKVVARIFAFGWFVTSCMCHFPKITSYESYLICFVSSLLTMFVLSIYTDVQPIGAGNDKTFLKIEQNFEPETLKKMRIRIRDKLTGLQILFALLFVLYVLMDMLWRSWYSAYYIIVNVKPYHTLSEFFGVILMGPSALFSACIFGQFFRKIFLKNTKEYWITIYRK